MNDYIAVVEFSAKEAMHRMSSEKLKCKVVKDSSSYYYIKDNHLIHHYTMVKKFRYSLISMNCGISQNFSLNVQRGKLQHRKTVVR